MSTQSVEPVSGAPSPHPAALDPATVQAHFERRLALEIDCADVQAAFGAGDPGFALLDVRSRAAYERGHVPGAQHLHHPELTAQRLADWPRETLFVVYCAGTHCNASQQAAVRIAGAGRAVKEMPGGLLGWRDEGFEVAYGSGSLEPRSPSTRLADAARRPLSRLPVRAYRGWRVKVYGIAATGAGPECELLDAACAQVLSALPPIDRAPQPPGVAFLIVHQGQDACWALLHWWLDGAVLQSKVWSSPLLEPTALEPLPPDVHLTCVWEYRVIAHECEAWTRAVAETPGRPDIEGYLESWIEGPI